MYNDSEKISANEINKYTFCPYQWYYERLYGQKNIRQKYKQEKPKKEKEEILKTQNKTLNNFSKGRNFHNNYRKKRMYILICKILLLIILSVIIIILLKYGKF